MSIKDGGPAFPIVEANGANSGCPGMSLRDYFAAKAMAGLMAGKLTTSDPDVIAKDCYTLADAMLKAREEA